MAARNLLLPRTPRFCMHSEALKFSRHGQQRASARRIPDWAIHAVFDCGRPFRSFNDVGWRLDRRTVLLARLAGIRLDRWEGITVIETQDGTIRTVWRDRSPQRIWR